MMIGRLAELAMAFAGTNMDNFIMISILLAMARSRKDRMNVCAAQYIGLAVLVLLSMAGAEIVRLLPKNSVRLLGLLPAAIGLRGLFASRGAEREDKADALPGLWMQTVMTLSGGMDNISVYIPLFKGIEGLNSMILPAAVFAGMMALWCLLADRTAKLPGLRQKISRHSDRLIPWIYILLGVYILIR